MEDWERELREKLQKELPDGYYQFPNVGKSGFVGGTGKLGWIDFEVELIKQMRGKRDDKNI